jgi:uncharacterized protein
MAPAGYDKFLPEGIPGWQQPFWDSLRGHDLRVQRCSACGTYRYHPKETCHRCSSRAADWVPIAGLGEVYTYTVVRRAPTPAYAPGAPYTIVHVKMVEEFRMIGPLEGVETSSVRIGMPVVLGYDDVTPEWTLLTFSPDGGPRASATG